MSLVQVTGTKFYRDTETMALINKDLAALEEYKLKRNLMEQQKREINNIKSELNDMKSDISEIKDLMLKLLEKG
jgi:hypothetical protein